jgi:hypothetical protein
MVRYISWMQWFENEVFWRTFYPYMFGERQMAARRPVKWKAFWR